MVCQTFHHQTRLVEVRWPLLRGKEAHLGQCPAWIRISAGPLEVSDTDSVQRGWMITSGLITLNESVLDSVRYRSSKKEWFLPRPSWGPGGDYPKTGLPE